MAYEHKKTKPFKDRAPGPQGTVVTVRDNNVGQAMRRLKKIMMAEGIFKELRERQFYVKPSIKRKRAKASARKRWQKELALKNQEQ